MSFYSLKMRASKNSQHVSGAEKILHEQELPAQMNALLSRALHHAKGQADFINMKIETVRPDDLEYINALPVSSIMVNTPEEGQEVILQYLSKLGIKNGTEIMKRFADTYTMRGAILLDINDLSRLEPDFGRGIRATYMDAEHSLDRLPDSCKNHFQEAIVLASKVVAAPHIIAEICISDDPDYVTGYIAAKNIGYVRISKLKNMGCPNGGRIFLYQGPKQDVDKCINYLEKQRVLVCHVPYFPNEKSIMPINYIQQMEKYLQNKKELHLYRQTREITSAQSAHVIYQGRRMLMLASNNYLGLSNNTVVKESAEQAIKKYGCGSGGSRLTTGTLSLHNQLECALAKFKNTEAALLFNTGYMANLGIISAICQKGWIIYSDELNHASIIDGCRLSSARIVIYNHNNMDSLEAKLREFAPCHGLIVTDAVFSMDGDIASLPQIMSLSHKYNVLTMVDEAHATGVIGPNGKGICEYYKMEKKPDILMGTLSKSLGSEGGYVCGCKILIDYLRNTARSYIFSTSQSPAALAAALTALDILVNHPGIVKKLQKNVQCFCETLRINGISANSDSAIVPIKIGDEAKTIRIEKELFQQNIFLTAIRYPTVAKGAAILRAAVMATHTEAEIQLAAKKISAAINL
ncbi:8-amino-7-oxononanoate synthase [Pectinatus frisingensis]|uniref:8-amino-7-oxononanoate synthase n=1 Tax=Pectinatus frisingensis TaxID=865 RepID=UPI0015F5A497|nr:8-amino-7-oxononanoate synthase [Pectinatus frisingensis]